MYTLFIFQDLLLLKATANSTLSCLGQCLRMLEHKQVGILTIYLFTYENIENRINYYSIVTFYSQAICLTYYKYNIWCRKILVWLFSLSDQTLYELLLSLPSAPPPDCPSYIVNFHIYIFCSETTKPNKGKFHWDGALVFPFQRCVRQPAHSSRLLPLQK